MRRSGPANAPRFAEDHDGILVDPGLAQILRHHTSTPEEFSDALRFCLDPATVRQFDVLFRNMGRRLPVNVHNFTIERRASGRILRCDIRFDLHVRWVNGRLRLAADRLPLTTISACYGKPLRSLLDHPYVPDLEVADIEIEDQIILHPRRRIAAR